MIKKDLGGYVFFTAVVILLVISMVAGSGFTFAKEKSGARVDPMKIMTATATMDPVRPEAARVIAEAFKSIGWDVQACPTDYNLNVQKVVLEHDYDMWLVMLSGASSRIDPNVFIYMCNHSSQYKKGGYNWEGFSDTEVDKLAEFQQVAMDVEKRREIVFEAQKLIHEAQPMNVLAYMQMTNAYRSDRIKNLVPMLGEGIGSFWSDINMEVLKGDGYVRTARPVALKNLNPVTAKDHSEFMELRMIYDRLFRIGPDGAAKPWAAESYTISNPTTIDITIRKGMLWHDGKPVTAEDIKFTFDYHTKWKAPFFYASLKNIESVEITGNHSIRIKLKKPHSPSLSNLLGGIFIIPKHIWKDIPEKVDIDDPLKYPNEKPIGSGPFKFDHWDRGRELRVSAFKQHFNPPKCAGIICLPYGSHDAIAAAIEKGECDRTRYILKPSLLLDLQKVKNVVAKGYPNHGFYTLTYNTRRPPLNDPVFRKAIAHVIPKDLIIEAILSNMADPGGSVIGPANKFWHNPAVKPFLYDVPKAKKILAEAGYTWDKKGKLHYPSNK
jgi:peptide/nickel transport system substrate-binding protein